MKRESVLQLLMSVYLSILPGVVKTQDCLQATGENQNLPNFADLGNQVRIPHGNQVIVSSYEFQCCGNISAWGADIYTHNHNGTFNIQFQVWRPSPTIESDGCYSLVGENKFTSLRLLQAGLILFENIELSQQIAAQPGDVVGFRLESDTTSNPGVVMDTSFSSEAVWYGNIDEIAGGPLHPVGVLQTSTNLGPVISASISSTSCPPPKVTPTPTIPITVICHTSTSTNILDNLTPTTSTSSLISPTPTTDSTNPTSTDTGDYETDDVTFFNNGIGTSDTGQELHTVGSTAGSTIITSLNTSINQVIIIVAGGVGILLLLLNVLVVISIFAYWKVQRTKDKRKINSRLSLTSMVYNTIYNGSRSNTLDTVNSYMVETTDHIYEAVTAPE